MTADEAVNVQGRRVLEDDGSLGNMVVLTPELQELSEALVEAISKQGWTTWVSEGTRDAILGVVSAWANDRETALRERVDLLEQWLGWIGRTCERNVNGEKAATYRGLVNFIDSNLPGAAQRVAEEEARHA